MVSIVVKGRLLAEGMPTDPIHFVPADPAARKPIKWGGISFERSRSVSILKWCRIESAGSISPNGMQLIAHNVITHAHTGVWAGREFSGTISHNVIAYSMYNGVLCHTTGPQASIVDNIFYMNGGGVEGLWGAVPHVNFNQYWRQNGGAAQYLKGVQAGPRDVISDPGFGARGEEDFSSPRQAEVSSEGGNGERGLDPRQSGSSAAAATETARWLGNGAREKLNIALELETRKQWAEAEKCYQEALAACEGAEQRDTDLAATLNTGLGRALAALGEEERAESVLRAAIGQATIGHWRDQARRALVDALLAAGKPAEAAAVAGEIEWAQSEVWAPALRARCDIMQKDTPALAPALARLKEKDPNQYLASLAELLDDAQGAGNWDAVLSLCDALEASPEAPAASRARLKAASALMKADRQRDAETLLRALLESDPLGRQAPQALAWLAEIEAATGREAAAHETLERLSSDFYCFLPLVVQARRQLQSQPLPPGSNILLDASLQESSVHDRGLRGSNNFGQYEVMRALAGHGFKVHTNEGARPLSAAEMAPYGLVIMHGRYGGTATPPIPPAVIDACEDYVKNGGNLLVIASGKWLGNGETAQFYNPLLDRFGLKFNTGSQIPWGSNRCDATDHPALAGLEGFRAYGGVEVEPGAGDDVLATFNGAPIIVAAGHGKGRCVAAGLGAGLLGCCMNPEANGNLAEIAANEALLIRLATCLSQAPEAVTGANRTRGEAKGRR